MFNNAEGRVFWEAQVKTETKSIDPVAGSNQISEPLHPEDEAASSATLPRPLQPARVPRVALVNLDDSSQQTFRECFDKFAIETVPIVSETGDFFHKENFQGCVLTLRSSSAPILEDARTSVLNRHTMIYGISGSPIAVIRFQRYGIHAILESPLDPVAVMEVVKATQALLKHQIRRYVRLPLMTLVQLNIGREIFAVNSRQISPAGMSLVTKQKLQIGQAARVTFTQPNMLQIAADVTVCWVTEDSNMVGVRFNSSNQGLGLVKSWMEEYLAIA